VNDQAHETPEDSLREVTGVNGEKVVFSEREQSEGQGFRGCWEEGLWET
jgi:hypothetical protein